MEKSTQPPTGNSVVGFMDLVIAVSPRLQFERSHAFACDRFFLRQLASVKVLEWCLQFGAKDCDAMRLRLLDRGIFVRSTTSRVADVAGNAPQITHKIQSNRDQVMLILLDYVVC